MTGRHIAVGWARCLQLLVCLAGCNARAPRAVEPDRPVHVDVRSEKTEHAQESQEQIAPRVVAAITIPDESEDRWLYVTRTRDDTPGGWATGSFDIERNKITIDTYDVTRFAIDTSRMPIDWDRGVILRLNGSNSELRKRDYPVLQFIRDEHGMWVVVEP